MEDSTSVTLSGCASLRNRHLLCCLCPPTGHKCTAIARSICGSSKYPRANAPSRVVRADKPASCVLAEKRCLPQLGELIIHFLEEWNGGGMRLAPDSALRSPSALTIETLYPKVEGPGLEAAEVACGLLKNKCEPRPQRSHGHAFAVRV